MPLTVVFIATAAAIYSLEHGLVQISVAEWLARLTAV